MRRVVMVVVFAGACATHDEAVPTRSQCQTLRGHVVDLRVATLPPQDVASHREALAASLGDAFVDHCQQLSLAEVRCALAAKDSSSVAACSTSR